MLWFDGFFVNYMLEVVGFEVFVIFVFCLFVCYRKNSEKRFFFILFVKFRVVFFGISG